MPLPTAIYRPLIAETAKASRLDPRWIEAQIMQESSGRARAFRYEPGLRDASYGLMQVLGKTARALGLPLDMRDASLCEPDAGIRWGVRALTDILDRIPGAIQARMLGSFESMTVLPAIYRIALARYNGGGHGNPEADGSLRNESYVQGVESWFAQVVLDLGG